MGPHLARLALEFGPPETLGLVVFSLAAIAGLASGDVVRAMGIGVAGMILAAIGLDQASHEPRMTFGIFALRQGLEIGPVMIGLFGVAEVLRAVERGVGRITRHKVGKLMPSRDELRRGSSAGARGTLLGFVLGLFPGMVPSITSFLSYSYEGQRARKRKDDRFGKGAIEGIGGPEAANNSAAMAGFVPLLSLGIPTGPSMALILAALLVYGIVPGPTLFANEPGLVATVIASFFVANIILLILNLPLVGVWIRIARIPYSLLGPIILTAAVVGAYVARFSIADVWVCMVFGLAGWGMSKWGLPIAPLVMGFILGPMLELSFRQSIAMSPYVFIQSPILIGFLIAAVVFVVVSTRLNAGADRGRK